MIIYKFGMGLGSCDSLLAFLLSELKVQGNIVNAFLCAIDLQIEMNNSDVLAKLTIYDCFLHFCC